MRRFSYGLGLCLGVCLWLFVGHVQAVAQSEHQNHTRVHSSFDPTHASEGKCWRRIRRRRWRRRKRRKKKKPRLQYDVLLKSLAPSGKIDKEKLRLSIKKKLKRIARCYGLVRKQATKTKKGKKSAKKRSKPKPKRKGIRTYGEVDVLVALNGFGRVTDVSLKRNRFPKRESDCFLWYFRGRKLFPPQGYKDLRVRMRLRVTDKQKKPKKRKKRKKR